MNEEMSGEQPRHKAQQKCKKKTKTKKKTFIFWFWNKAL
jgi:hypothetical protein